MLGENKKCSLSIQIHQERKQNRVARVGGKDKLMINGHGISILQD